MLFSLLDIAQETGKRIEEIALEHHKLTVSVALHDASQKYVDLLYEVQTEFHEIVQDIQYPLSDIQKHIGYSFDVFDSHKNTIPHLRHAFDESLTIIRHAYDCYFDLQPGGYILEQMKFLKSLDRENLPNRNKQYFHLFSRPKAISPKEYIDQSSDFSKNIRYIYERIPANKETELYKYSFQYIDEGQKLLVSYHDQLDALYDRLENGLKRNDIEQFDLTNITNLGDQYLKIKKDIDRVRKLYPCLSNPEDYYVHNGIALTLYAGMIFFLLSDYSQWGKRKEVSPYISNP